MALARFSVIGIAALTGSFAFAGDVCEFLPGSGVRGLGYGPDFQGGNANCSAIFDYGAGPMLFVGGKFSLAGPVPVGNIARYDGSQWNAVTGGDLNGEVTAMCVVNGELFVAGSFTQAGSVAANKVARWDGGAWRACGNITETNLTIRAMVNFDGRLICGGNISTIAGVTINGLARWSGSSWSSYATLAEQSGPGDVHTMLVDGNLLYIGGALDHAGTITVANIARYDLTTGLWNDLGGGCGLPTGATEWVYSLAKRNSDIFALGTFTRAGGNVAIQKIARWDGFGWFAAGSAFRYGDRLGMNGNNLFAEMQLVDGGSYVSKWNGAGWDETAGFPASGADIRQFASYNNDLIVLGRFEEVDGKGVRNIARFGGTNWFPIGVGSNAPVTGFTTFQGQPVAFGEFKHLDGTATDYIARWDGTAWRSFAPGLITPPLCALEANGMLFVGGQGTLTNVAGTDGVAAWDGTNWLPIDGGFGLTPFVCTVRSLATYAGRLYAGGSNLHLGQVTDYIAQLDGTNNWVPVGGGTNGTVYAMRTYLGRLIVAGDYTDAGGTAAMNIAAWNGTTWAAMGAGLGNTSDYPRALAIHAGVLVAGGDFVVPATGNPRGLAYWNGTTWVPVGDTYYNTSARVLFSHNGALYVAGDYFDPNVFPNDYMNRYKNGAWVDVDGGPDGDVLAFGADGDDLLVGGNFMMAGGEVSAYLARFNCVDVPDVIGDTDGDGDVDIQDLANVLAHFGVCAPDPNYSANADFDNDNCVTLQDLALLLANFGT